MTRHAAETWIVRVQLPAGLPNPARYLAAVLKHLGRRWGIQCVALEESIEVKRLQGIIQSLAARVAAQSELLSRQAERRNVS